MLTAFELPPGFLQGTTDYDAEGRWVAGDKVRSLGGVIETMGGWVRFHENEAFVGKARSLMAWYDLRRDRLVAFGTHRRLYRLTNNELFNITPIMSSGSLNNAITTNGTTTVSITHTNHGLDNGAFVTFANQGAPVDGVDLTGQSFEIVKTGANSYQIQLLAAATGSTVGAGGNLDYEYEINPGLERTIFGYGYGVGPYGRGAYGTPRTDSFIVLDARTWTMDDWGEDLIAAPVGGNVYLFDRSVGGRAALLSNAPTGVRAVFVTEERIVVCLGQDNDPLLARWSDQGNNNNFLVSAATQAGDFRATIGGQWVRGMPLQAGLSICWTDEAVYTMAYLGRSPWHRFDARGEGSGLVGPNAATVDNGIAFWMSNEKFLFFDGSVRELPRQTDVLNFVFEDFNRVQGDLVYCFSMKRYGEIWWLYPSAASEEIDRYVVYSLREGVWYTGTLERTAAVDSQIYPDPIMAGDDGYLYFHEVGDDANGHALRKFIESSDFDMADGDNNMEVDVIVPDFDDLVGNVTVTIKTRDYPNDPDREEASEVINAATRKADVRASGRHASVRFESNEVGGRFRLGKFRFGLNQAGGRR